MMSSKMYRYYQWHWFFALLLIIPIHCSERTASDDTARSDVQSVAPSLIAVSLHSWNSKSNSKSSGSNHNLLENPINFPRNPLRLPVRSLGSNNRWIPLKRVQKLLRELFNNDLFSVNDSSAYSELQIAMHTTTSQELMYLDTISETLLCHAFINRHRIGYRLVERIISVLESEVLKSQNTQHSRSRLPFFSLMKDITQKVIMYESQLSNDHNDIHLHQRYLVLLIELENEQIKLGNDNTTSYDLFIRCYFPTVAKLIDEIEPVDMQDIVSYMLMIYIKPHLPIKYLEMLLSADVFSNTQENSDMLRSMGLVLILENTLCQDERIDDHYLELIVKYPKILLNVSVIIDVAKGISDCTEKKLLQVFQFFSVQDAIDRAEFTDIVKSNELCLSWLLYQEEELFEYGDRVKVNQEEEKYAADSNDDEHRWNDSNSLHLYPYGDSTIAANDVIEEELQTEFAREGKLSILACASTISDLSNCTNSNQKEHASNNTFCRVDIVDTDFNITKCERTVRVGKRGQLCCIIH